MKDYLKINELIKDAWYIVRARNFNCAYWNGEVFIGVRFKFGMYHEDVEKHIDNDGTVEPVRLFDYD